MRIAVANRKGGTAKTTSAMYLAAAATLRGVPARVYDADPQASATLWADMAEDSGDPLPFDVIPANARSLGRLDGRGCALIDAPSDGSALDAAMEAADLIVVPSSDSALDLQQAWLTLRTTDPRTPALVLLTRAERNTRAYMNAVAAMEEASTPRLAAVVLKRQAIKNSLGRRPAKLYEYAEAFSEIMGLGARA